MASKGRWAADDDNDEDLIRVKKEKEEKRQRKAAEKARKAQEEQKAAAAQARRIQESPAQKPQDEQDEAEPRAKRRKLTPQPPTSAPEAEPQDPPRRKLLRFPTAGFGPARSVDNYNKLNDIEEGTYGWVARARRAGDGQGCCAQEAQGRCQGQGRRAGHGAARDSDSQGPEP